MVVESIAAHPEVAEWGTWAIRGLLGVVAAVVLAYANSALARVEERSAAAMKQIADASSAGLAELRIALESMRRDRQAVEVALQADTAELRRKQGAHEVELAREGERWQNVQRELTALRMGVTRIEGRLLAGRRAVSSEPDEGDGERG